MHLQHHRLPQRIDRRIRHLCEALPEKRVQRPRRSGQRRNRRIVAHRPHRILTLGGHRLQDHAHIFARVAEPMLQTIQLSRIKSCRCRFRILERRIEHDQILVMPLRVVDAQNLVVLEEAIEVEVSDDHLPRPQTAAMHNVLGVHVDQAGLGTRVHQSFVVQRKSARPQPVAVENRAHLASVRESQRSGPVPWLDQIAAVLQKRRLVARIGGWYQHPHRLTHGAPIVR